MYFAHNNQRSFQRMALDLPITITKNGVLYHAMCHDLSSTGMSIQFTESSFQADDLVHIELKTVDKRFPPLCAQAKLIRIHKEEGRFIAAVEFLTLS